MRWLRRVSAVSGSSTAGKTTNAGVGAMYTAGNAIATLLQASTAGNPNLGGAAMADNLHGICFFARGE